MEDMEETKSQRAHTCEDLQNSRIFEELFETYGKKLFRYFYLHLSSKEDAEDALSTTFVKLWEYAHAPRNRGKIIGNVSAFLYRIAHNLLVDTYRTRRPAISVEVMMEAGIELPAIKTLSMDKRAEVSRIVSTFDRLEAQERDLLLLRFVEDLPVVDIAEMYDITENNASVRIHRALNKLRALVHPSNITPTEKYAST